MVRTAHPTNINGPEDGDVSNKSGSPRDLQVVLQVYIMTKFHSPLLGAAILVVAQATFTTVHAEETLDMTATDSQESASQIYTLNRIAAVVNGEVILVSELNTSVRKVEEQLNKKGTQLPDKGVLIKQVLERLIVDNLQMQIAERNGLTIDDNTLNEEIQTLASKNGINLSEFREVLEKEGYSYTAFRENIRKKLILEEVRRQMVANRIRVNDQEINNLLASLEASGLGDVKYHLAHIMVTIPEAPGPDEIEAARLRASNILMRLHEGSDFEQMAIAESDGQNALEGGDIGWRSMGQIPSLFTETTGHLQVGQVSDLIQSSGGFHIIKLLEKSGEEKHMVNQTKVRHILIKTDTVNTEEDVKIRMEQLEIRLEGGEDFSELARSNSQDTLSAARGGELGWVNQGDTVPRFEDAMNKLAIGETSKPVQSRFGWHIIQVEARRQHDSTDQYERARAKQLIQTRKYEEELALWLRRLRDESYVEYRLDDT
jgi:peptidyl-prolyl cis-trans isomerase SurA